MKIIDYFYCRTNIYLYVCVSNKGNKQKTNKMKTSKILKSLTKTQEMLTVINSQTLRGSESDLLAWKKLNIALKEIESARAILFNNN